MLGVTTCKWRGFVLAVFLALTAACKFKDGAFDDRACGVDLDCRPDQTCKSGLCTQNECTTADECGPGFQYSCEDGLCVVAACTDGSECTAGFGCSNSLCSKECGVSDADGDNVCDNVDNCMTVANFNQLDTDGDQQGDACDACANDADNDIDADTICGDVDNCVTAANTDQLDRDEDTDGDACDADDDNDGVADAADPAQFDPRACGDSDGDTCDDCVIGVDQFGALPDRTANNDGTDFDADGLCDAGDVDDDNDGVVDGNDRCAQGDTGFVSSSTTDVDGDGCRDAGAEDDDDDNDGVVDAADPNDANNKICGDSDADACDDCTVGVDGFGELADNLPGNDGLDTDGDGKCNTGDPDDDNDSVLDGADTNPLDPFICRDVDGDGCNDCAVTGGPPSTTNDGLDSDSDGTCNGGDADDDNDGVADSSDPADVDPTICGRDVDADGCDDCAVGVDGFGPAADFSAANDGVDTDADGQCNSGDPDDDNDTVIDANDPVPLDNNLCGDSDADTCDDCVVTGGPPSAAGDGLDTDSDGKCNAGDPDDDNDGVLDGADTNPLNRFVCADSDSDTCDDCAVTGGPANPNNDGTDTNADGQCNDSDPDDDGDTVVDGSDVAPLDRFRCRDLDNDSCDDCVVTGGPPDPANDGTDVNPADGVCDVSSSADNDGDTVPNGSDANPNNKFICQDLDADGCDDCSQTGGPPNTANDGTDTDGDLRCNTSDPDDDNDGVVDTAENFDLDPTRCGLDADADACDDCAVGVDGFGPSPDNVPANDGLDTDGDGACNTGDTDDDNDTVLDGVDTNPLNKFICRDQDADTCDDCAVTGGPPANSNDGTDTDGDGRCNAGDTDDDNDTVLDGVDTNPLDRFVCRDTDADTCDDCAVSGGPPATNNDGLDTDADGLCNAGDADDDNDTVTDANDNDPLNNFVCRDQDADTCDDCSVTGGPPNTLNDGPDSNANGICDLAEPCNEEIVFVGAGTQDSDTSGTLTPTLPTFVAGDLAIAFVAGRPSGDDEPAVPAGWTKRSSKFLEIGNNDLKVITYTRRLQTGDTAPAFAVPAAWTGGGGGMSAAIAVWRGVDPTTAFDVADTTSTGAASQTFTAPTISTGSSNARVITVVATNGVNNLGLSTANSFVERMTGGAFDTNTGGDHSLGVADRLRLAPGATTMPVWNQAADSPKNWVAITFALRTVGGSACTAIVAMDGGGSHTCALIDDIVNPDTVRCWGEAASGQLGYGNTNDLGDANGELPTANISVGGAVAEIVAGFEHTCARLITDGKVRCWGNGADGRLGYGNTTSIGDTETPTGDVNLGAGNNNEAIQLAAGEFHTCALVKSDDVRCWGKGADGRLGTGGSTNIGDDETPASIAVVNLSGANVTQIVAGDSHTCARISGNVRCWGNGSSGQLGYGNTNSIGDAANELPMTTNVNVGGTVSQLVAGGSHTCALLSTGVVRCWGNGSSGQLGYGNTDTIGDASGEMPPADVSVGGTVAELVAGKEHTCARLTTGVVRCWGRGDLGALGYGNTNDIGDTETPASAGDVPLRRTAIKIMAGDHHTCAILDTGDVQCWGQGGSGRLGYGNTNTIGDNELLEAVGLVPVE